MNETSISLRVWICLLALISLTRAAGAGEIAVELVDPPATGTVVFALFNTASGFGDPQEAAQQIALPLDGRDDYRLTDLPPGSYALLIYLDENENGLMDRNFIGIPKEPLGFSNGYRPKGPPNFNRAAFVLESDDSRRFNIDLRRPLGDRGQWGIGLAVIAQESPYRQYNGGVYQVFPAVTYSGERLQIFGPFIQYGLLGSGRLRLAATGTYRIGPYKEKDSPFLEGMGDADSTFMAGLAMQAELPGNVDLTLSYSHDLFNRIGGGALEIGVDRSFQTGPLTIKPGIGISWTHSDLVNNDFGVSAANARPDRPAYQAGSLLDSKGEIIIFMDVSESWLLILDVGIEFLGSEATDSPIVDKASRLSGFAALSYVF